MATQQEPTKILIECEGKSWEIQGECAVSSDQYQVWIFFKGFGDVDEIFAHLYKSFSVSLTRNGRCLKFENLEIFNLEMTRYRSEAVEYRGKLVGATTSAVTILTD